jgi:hypothetical protein
LDSIPQQEPVFAGAVLRAVFRSEPEHIIGERFIGPGHPRNEVYSNASGEQHQRELHLDKRVPSGFGTGLIKRCSVEKAEIIIGFILH